MRLSADHAEIRRWVTDEHGLEGWGADYPDPANFINVLLMGGNNIRDDHNQNVSYFNDPSFNRRLKAAALMSGAAVLSSTPPRIGVTRVSTVQVKESTALTLVARSVPRTSKVCEPWLRPV